DRFTERARLRFDAQPLRSQTNHRMLPNHLDSRPPVTCRTPLGTGTLSPVHQQAPHGFVAKRAADLHRWPYRCTVPASLDSNVAEDIQPNRPWFEISCAEGISSTNPRGRYQIPWLDRTMRVLLLRFPSVSMPPGD